MPYQGAEAIDRHHRHHRHPASQINSSGVTMGSHRASPGKPPCVTAGSVGATGDGRGDECFRTRVTVYLLGKYRE